MPEPGTLFEITNRTAMGRLLLRPSEELNAIILGCLGRALDQFTNSPRSACSPSSGPPTTST